MKAAGVVLGSVAIAACMDVIGRTRMTNTLRWNPVFEDVTGKGFVDQ